MISIPEKKRVVNYDRVFVEIDLYKEARDKAERYMMTNANCVSDKDIIIQQALEIEKLKHQIKELKNDKDIK